MSEDFQIAAGMALIVFAIFAGLALLAWAAA